MNLKKTLISSVGVLAMSLSVFAGAAAQDTDTMTTSVQISCDVPATVDLIGDSVAFDPITDIFNDRSTSTAPGAIGVEVDMGCYWGPWQVNASTTNFIAGPGVWFHASHFSLVDSNVDAYFLDPLDGPFDILEPQANDAYFFGPSDEDVILETDENWIWWPFIQGPDTPAPFVTEASYTGELNDLPMLLNGNYSATLTVELALE